MDRTIRTEPLTKAAFATFGQVIETDGARHYPINAGNCERYHDLARVEIAGPGARSLISLLHSRGFALPFTFSLVERHPFGSQAFYPLSPNPFLVIVAPDENGTPGTPRAFLTGPGQGINLAINTWHGVLTPIGPDADFLCVDRGGDGDNLEEYTYVEAWRVEKA